MFNIAYDKETKQILGFIESNYDINPKEVFQNFNNYEVVVTNQTPPSINFNDYIININKGDVYYTIIEKTFSDFEKKQNKIELLREELKNSNQTLLDFLEGEISVTDYAETKLKRQSIRKEMKKLEAEILALKGEKDG